MILSILKVCFCVFVAVIIASFVFGVLYMLISDIMYGKDGKDE